MLEVGRSRRERRSGGKTDALDAVGAARSVLTSERPTTPRAGGERQALQAFVAAREGAVNAKRAGLCQLRDLLITTPEPLRSELRPLTRARLLQRLAATRPGGGRDPELRGSMLALRSIARRVLQLTAEERELAREIETITRKLAPQLLDQTGVGPHAAAQLVLSWSHQGRITSEAAFARLAGVATYVPVGLTYVVFAALAFSPSFIVAAAADAAFGAARTSVAGPGALVAEPLSRLLYRSGTAQRVFAKLSALASVGGPRPRRGPSDLNRGSVQRLS